jgi:adenine-specific DNA-methyltransferase
MVNGEWSIVNSEKDEYGTRLVANPESSGRYHSDWLTMMYPRLKLARNLLTDDGVIFISIDDNEVHNLRKVCDEVFGEENFVGCFVWKRRSSSSLDQSKASTDHEYVFAFHRGIFKSLRGSKKDYEGYSNPDNDPRGLWTTGDLTVGMNGDMRPNQFYDLIDPKTGKVYKANFNRVWSYTPESMQKLIIENRVIFPEDENKRPMRKRFANELNSETNPFSTWMINVGMNTEGTRIVNSLFDGTTMFNYVKPLSLLQNLIDQVTFDKDIILDFFSGSATTAHAVMQLNAEDGGNRKYIMVQLPELTDKNSEAFKAGYQNICEIGKERIRRAAKLIVNGKWSMLNEKKEKLEKMVNGKLVFVNDKFIFPEGIIIDETAETLLQEINHLQLTINNFDTGFRVYRLDTSNMEDVYYRPQDYKQDALDLFADNIKPDRTADDLLAQVMLDWGLPLSYKIEQATINGKQVFRVAQDSLLACFDKGIDEDFAKIIAKEKPLRIVFRDSGFANDTAKINVQQLLKQLSPETEMKVI